jgi:hypothetical protein
MSIQAICHDGEFTVLLSMLCYGQGIAENEQFELALHTRVWIVHL